MPAIIQVIIQLVSTGQTTICPIWILCLWNPLCQELGQQLTEYSMCWHMHFCSSWRNSNCYIVYNLKCLTLPVDLNPVHDLNIVVWALDLSLRSWSEFDSVLGIRFCLLIQISIWVVKLSSYLYMVLKFHVCTWSSIRTKSCVKQSGFELTSKLYQL